MFQLMFAIITPGLVVGGDRRTVALFRLCALYRVFSLLVYAPLAHWSWHPDGFLQRWARWIIAGGTVVHISAGCAALAAPWYSNAENSHIDRVEMHPAIYPMC